MLVSWRVTIFDFWIFMGLPWLDQWIPVARLKGAWSIISWGRSVRNRKSRPLFCAGKWKLWSRIEDGDARRFQWIQSAIPCDFQIHWHMQHRKTTWGLNFPRVQSLVTDQWHSKSWLYPPLRRFQSGSFLPHTIWSNVRGAVGQLHLMDGRWECCYHVLLIIVYHWCTVDVSSLVIINSLILLHAGDPQPSCLAA